MSKDRILFVLVLLWVASTTPQVAYAAGPIWSVSVTGLKGEPLGTLTLELTDETARTCMSGDWKKAHIIKSTFQSLKEEFEAKGYFPTYEANGQGMTIQLNSPGLCDAYLMLGGKFSERDGTGNYYSMGLGGVNPRGTFKAKRQ